MKILLFLLLSIPLMSVAQDPTWSTFAAAPIIKCNTTNLPCPSDSTCIFAPIKKIKETDKERYAHYCAKKTDKKCTGKTEWIIKKDSRPSSSNTTICYKGEKDDEKYEYKYVPNPPKN